MWPKLARFLSRHPLAVVSLAVALSVLSAAYAATHLTFTGSRGALAGKESPQRRLHETYLQEFPDRDPVLVVARGPRSDRAEGFAAAVATRLAAEVPGVRAVRHRIDAGALRSKGLLYLSPEDLRRLRDRLEQHAELIRRVAAAPALTTLLAEINREVGRRMVGHLFTGFLEGSEPGGGRDGVDLGLLLPLLDGVAAAAAGRRPGPPPWEAWLAPGRTADGARGFLWSEGNEFLFVLVEVEPTPGRLNRYADPVAHIRRIVGEVRGAFAEVEAGVTGGPALEADEMTAIQRDMTVASLLSLVGVGILLTAAFRSTITPVLALLSLAMGVCWAFGFATLTVGRLNIISASLAPMLIGLGIDHNIHLLARFEEERARRPSGFGLARALGGVGPSVCRAALTIAAAFYALMATGYQGLMELGLLAGSGVLLTLLAALTVLPAMMVLDWRWRKPPPVAGAEARPRAPGRLARRAPWRVLAVGSLAALAGLAGVPHLRYDMNPLNLQTEGSEAVAWATRLLESRNGSPQHVVVLAGRLDDARTKAESLRALPPVRRVESLTDWIPERQDEKLLFLQDIGALLEDIDVRPREKGPLDIEGLAAVLGRIRFKMAAPSDAGDALAAKMGRTQALVDRTRAHLDGRGAERASPSLQRYEEKIFRDLADELGRLQGAAARGPITPADLPDGARERFVGKNGRYALRVYPRGDPWDPAQRGAFLAAVRGVDPGAVGDLAMLHEDTGLLVNSSAQGALYALAAGFALLCLTFRSLGRSLAALIPLGLGLAWTAGLMALFQIRFNLANLVAIPLLIGVAIEHGTMVVARLGGRAWNGRVIPRGTFKGIVLACLTSMVGFGSLMVADHRGVFSVGLLVFLGTGAVLVASVGVLPALLGGPERQGGHPADHETTIGAARKNAGSGREKEGDP